MRIALADGRPPEELNDDTEEVVRAIADAGVVVLATPVYRSSLTGTLKNLLDQVPVAALRDTPTAIVAMGASDHHFLGAERHLRDVLAFFGALVVPTAAYLTGRDFSDGVPSAAAGRQLDEVLGSALSPPGRSAGPRSGRRRSRRAVDGGFVLVIHAILDNLDQVR